MNRLFVCHKSINSKLITMNFQDFLVFQQPQLSLGRFWILRAEKIMRVFKFERENEFLGKNELLVF